MSLLKAQPLPRAYALQSGKSKSTKYHNRPYFGQVLIEEADLYLTTSASPTGDTTCSHCERSCEGSCHAFLLPVPRRWATQPALTANAPAKVAAMPSCY